MATAVQRGRETRQMCASETHTSTNQTYPKATEAKLSLQLQWPMLLNLKDFPELEAKIFKIFNVNNDHTYLISINIYVMQRAKAPARSINTKGFIRGRKMLLNPGMIPQRLQ